MRSPVFIPGDINHGYSWRADALGVFLKNTRGVLGSIY